jgi:hypothetical protein
MSSGGDAALDRAPITRIARVPDDPHMRQSCHPLGRSVGRAVIDYDDFKCFKVAFRWNHGHFAHRFENRRGFVVDGDDK